jgi:hypothetical protein
MYMSLEEEESNMDWGSSAAVDWGAPVESSKSDELVLNWDDDENDKG